MMTLISIDDGYDLNQIQKNENGVRISLTSTRVADFFLIEYPGEFRIIRGSSVMAWIIQ